MIRFGTENTDLGGLPFLMYLRDGPDNELHVVLAAEEIGDSGYVPEYIDNQELRKLIPPLKQLIPNEEKLWLISFEGYIMYTIRNESYSQYGPDERFEGRVLRIFDTSILLDYVTKATIAQQFDDGEWFPGKWKHYAISTQNHTVDVIVVEEPVIRNVRWKQE